MDYLKRVYFKNKPDDVYWQTGETPSTILFWIENGDWRGEYHKDTKLGFPTVYQDHVIDMGDYQYEPF